MSDVMGDRSIFGERSGSAPGRDASAPASSIRKPAKGLFGTVLAANASAAAQARSVNGMRDSI
jgi:hypothetical protein